MDCIKCKKPLQEDFLWCPYCGKKQVSEKRHRKRANNTGTIYKREGNLEKPWIAKKNNMYIGSYKTRTEAQKALERITDVEVSDNYNLTLKEVYERWHADHGRTIETKTLKDYEWAFRLCEPLHDRKIRSILRSDYQACIIAQEEKGRSKGTCNKVRVILGMLGRWAFEEGITLSNNAENLSTTAKQLTVREIFLDGDIRAMQQSGMPAADIALILISCGCRPGELFKLKTADCFDDYFIGGSKTEAGKNRVIPVGKEGLDAYRRIRQKAAEAGSDNFIDGYTGSHVYNNYSKREWKALMAQIGRPDFTPYSCRHTFITNAIRSGMDLPILEAIVGHVDRETTRIYTHLRADDLVYAVHAVNTSPLTVVNKLSTVENSKNKTNQKSS